MRVDKTTEIDKLRSNLNCFVVWRYINPDKCQFTWQTKDLSKQSRTDFWLISTVMEKEVIDVFIEPPVLTDHKLIYISVNLNNTKDQDKRTRSSYWKLNNALLEDKQFLSMAKLTINENWRKAKALNSFREQLEFLKYQIRRLATHRGKEMAKDKWIMEDNITKKIIMIYDNPDTNLQDREKLITLQLQLVQIYEDKVRGPL